VKQLIAYLLDHAMLDFSGELTIDMVKEFLRDEESSEARSLLNKITQEGGVEEMQITLADCLQDCLRTGLSEGVVGEQLKLYAES
jgi:type IV secretory pathway ATPase VirB11/archaellum biosynthesis ATPase